LILNGSDKHGCHFFKAGFIFLVDFVNGWAYCSLQIFFLVFLLPAAFAAYSMQQRFNIFYECIKGNCLV
jgi:hypothetical protein